MKTDETFHERLKRDFGLDLPIGPGSGSSRDDPLVILASDPHTVALTQMLVLRCLGVALERLWRIVGRVPMKGEWANIDQVKIEAKNLTATEIITDQVNHYFDVAELVVNGRAASEQNRETLCPLGYFDPKSGIALPYEIGWFHYHDTIANEPNYPGLGDSIRFMALNSTASLYVYDRNARNIPERFDADFLHGEFAAAASDVFQFDSSASSAGDRRQTASRLGAPYLRQDFKIGAERSVLALTAARRRYVKLRITWSAEPLFDEIGNEFIDAFFDLVSIGNQAH